MPDPAPVTSATRVPPPCVVRRSARVLNQYAASTTNSEMKLGISCERTSSTSAIDPITTTIAAIAK